MTYRRCLNGETFSKRFNAEHLVIKNDMYAYCIYVLHFDTHVNIYIREFDIRGPNADRLQ